jgi:D-sedoheptulose 7-phosphate isomerase
MTFPNKQHIKLGLFLKDYAKEIDKGFNSIDLDTLDKITLIMEKNIRLSKTIYCCGNGGSSAIAEHFVCDFLKGVSTDTDIQPVIHSLTSNVPTLTAVANDISYEDIFSFQLKKYATADDLLICVSSSGNSPNIINALKSAKDIGITTISFVGFSGGHAKKISDYCIHIDIDNYGVVEDVHQSIMHMLAQFIRLKNLNSHDQIDEKVF